MFEVNKPRVKLDLTNLNRAQQQTKPIEIAVSQFQDFDGIEQKSSTITPSFKEIQFSQIFKEVDKPDLQTGYLKFYFHDSIANESSQFARYQNGELSFGTFMQSAQRELQNRLDLLQMQDYFIFNFQYNPSILIQQSTLKEGDLNMIKEFTQYPQNLGNTNLFSQNHKKLVQVNNEFRNEYDLPDNKNYQSPNIKQENEKWKCSPIQQLTEVESTINEDSLGIQYLNTPVKQSQINQHLFQNAVTPPFRNYARLQDKTDSARTLRSQAIQNQLLKDQKMEELPTQRNNRQAQKVFKYKFQNQKHKICIQFSDETKFEQIYYIIQKELLQQPEYFQ